MFNIKLMFYLVRVIIIFFQKDKDYKFMPTLFMCLQYFLRRLCSTASQSILDQLFRISYMATLPRRDNKHRSSGERQLPRSMSDDNYCLPSPDSGTKPDVRTLVTMVTNCI